MCQISISIIKYFSCNKTREIEGGGEGGGGGIQNMAEYYLLLICCLFDVCVCLFCLFCFFL